MSNTSVISLKVESELKDQATAVANDLGIPLATYLKMCLKKLKDEQSISFQRTEKLKPLVAKQLEKQMKEVEEGKNIVEGGSSTKELMNTLLSE